ncbi:MAG: anti-sigma factor antagonist [Mycobacterium sp.]|uniref:Anti-sigma factor antagonist n=1 Tax=Mycobacterium gordonae TaxID=1778 RepID=A0A1A6B9B7_MYCGO|nr:MULTISPECIES: STAS domain-containing protein [Mycobacterium]MDP7707032.1 STAS domain-containing protein [Mycobacterium sp. TY815]MDP7732807.1 STAS domain-containing protein [Mycobacterium sp. TY813]OBR98946.1 hypothetical protein A9W98_32715 [Mycobacterium gordonae]PJE00498.1 MAG: anti-sigma factor antagonist [Mycobacterium sp.]PJE05100.1 MAG: anti-sigma factor antagonist [Mycobacterium sp.]
MNSSHGLRLLESYDGAVLVLSASGVIDLATTPHFAHRVNEVLKQRPAALIIDLSHVEFMSAVGIDVLVQAHHATDTTAYAVVADGPATARPLRLTGLHTVIAIYPSVAEARKGLRTAPPPSAEPP